MKIEVDVKRAEQSWDLETHVQQNYLVIEVLGLEVRVPCDEEQLCAAIAQLNVAVEAEEEELPDELAPSEPVVVNPTFVAEPQVAEQAAPVREQRPARRLAPIKRERGDDVGIAQG